MKIKKLLIIILVIIPIIFIAYFIHQRIFIGEQAEREKLLEAVIWKLQEEGYTKNDVQSIEIKYAYFKGGTRPYEAYIVFEKDTTKEIIYTWDSKDKNYVKEIGFGSH